MTTMKDVEREFQSVGQRRGGVLFLTPNDAIHMVNRAREENIRVLGIDGFFLRPSETEPSLEHSIDLSLPGQSPADSWEVAQRFLERYLNSSMHFEVVLE